MASDIQTYLKELQAALAASGADPALVQDALFDAEEHLQAEMAVGGVVGRGTATYEARFAAAVEGYGSPEEVAAAYTGTAPAHEVVAAFETVLASGAATAAAPAFEMAPAMTAPATTEPPAATAAGATETARRSCQTCGQELGPVALFCTVCGTAVEASPAARLADTTMVWEAPVAPGAATPPAPPTPPTPQTAPPYGYGQYPAGVQAGMAAAAAGAAAPESFWRQVFGVFADPAVYKALVYMILSLGTGIAYFTIVVTGVSTAGGMLVLIVGIPLMVLVLGLVRAMALFEGRLVEWLLGARMPRRMRAVPPGTNVLERIWFWVKDGRTWASMAYMILMLPLGIAYFTVAVTCLATSIGLIAAPAWGWFGDHTVIYNGITYDWWFPVWGIPLAFIGGVLLLVGTMHLIRWVGRGHAAFAKAMLVRLEK